MSSESLLRGKAFEEAMLTSFRDIIKTTFSEDVFEKKDFKQVISFQAKSLGYILREYEHSSEHYKWVEMMNVNGDGGSIISGVDYLVFELSNYFLIVPRENLFTFCKSRMDATNRLKRENIKELLEGTSHDLSALCYRPYTRKERQDILLLVPTIDIVRCGGVLIDKE